MTQPYLYIATILSILNPAVPATNNPTTDIPHAYLHISEKQILANHAISLNNRYKEEWINEVFKSNILLTLDYLNGNVRQKADINWEKIESPKKIEFTLNPGESFAFHDQILAGIRQSVVKTTNAHFNYREGFKSDGLYGDGVCHLASLMYWAAKDADLEANAPVNHNFAKINEIPEEYGVSIYTIPGGFEKSSRENLYLTNNKAYPVTFIFDYDGSYLSLKITASS